jgi:hypothetical protein
MLVCIVSLKFMSISPISVAPIRKPRLIASKKESIGSLGTENTLWVNSSCDGARTRDAVMQYMQDLT